MRTYLKFIFILFLIGISLTELYASNDLSKQINLKMKQMIGNTGPAVTIIASRNGKIIFQGYYGLVDIEKKSKVTGSDILGIASLSKHFTGLAVLMLIEDGKLRLDEEILKYFPKLPIGKRKITIRQLMSHTSGLPELTQINAFMNTVDKPHTPEQIIAFITKGEFRSKPGEKWNYNNTGYAIIAALIEKISGMTYGQFLNKRIFKPLNMTSTYAGDYNHNEGNTVKRYLKSDKGYGPAHKLHFSNLIGGGSIFSNVKDLNKWGNALISGKNMPKNLSELWKPVLLSDGKSTGYGLGLGIKKFLDRKIYYHPGQGDGMNAFGLLFPKDKVYIAVIRNVWGSKVTAEKIAFSVAECILIKKQDPLEINKMILNGDIKKAMSKIDKLIKTIYKNNDLKKEYLKNIGESLLEKNKTDIALKVLNKNIEIFPEYANNYFTLSKVYELKKNKKLSVENYKTGIDLNTKKNLKTKRINKNLLKTATQVIDNYLKVIGGKKTLKNINTMIIKGRGKGAGNIGWTLTRFKKKPYFVRQNYSGGYFDSTDGISFYSGKGKEFKKYKNEKESPLSRVPDINRDFINYESKGISYKYEGLEGMGYAVFYKLKKIFKDKSFDHLLFDIETGLLSIIRTETSMGTELINLHDYRKTFNLLFPYLRVTTFDHQRAPHLFFIDKIEINKPIPDKMFFK